MSVKKQLAHNTFVQLVGKIISTGLGLIAIGMLTRYLGVEQFGWYATTLAFLQFVAILIDFGLIPVTSQMMSEVPRDLIDKGEEKLMSYRDKLLKNLLGFRFVTAVVGLGLAPLIALFLPYPPEVKIAISFTTINMLAVSMNQIFTGYYQSKLLIHFQVLGEVLGRIALLIGLLFCIRLDAGFIPVMWVITISSVIYTLAMWFFARRNTKAVVIDLANKDVIVPEPNSAIGFAFDWDVWKKIAVKMWPIAISIMFNVVYLRGDTIILSIFRDQAEVGLYGAAYRVIDIVAQVAMMVMGLMLPLLAYAWSTGDDKKFKEHFQLAWNVMMMFAIPMAVGLIVLAEPIVRVVAGDAFIPAALPLALLSIAVFGLFIGAVFGHVAVAVDRQKETIPVYLSNAVITLILYLIFIPRYGMVGAAAISVFSELFAGILLYVVIQKYTNISLSFRVTAKAVGAGILMAITVYPLRDHLILAILTGSLVYSLSILVTKAVSTDTIRDIVRLKKT
jgi:O-antigen/teichoic acid export membrane protein